MTPPDAVDARMKKINHHEELAVRFLGDRIGYGRLMQLAEQIWGEITPGAQHTTGPCAAFMVQCSHPIKDDYGHCDICCGAGRITEGVAKLVKSSLQPEKG